MNQIIRLFFFAAIIFLVGCSKDTRRVRYRVISQSSAEISYRMNGGFIQFENVSGDWSKSFRSRSGSPIYLTGMKTSPFGKLNILVYIDGELTHSLITEQQFSPLVIEAEVP
jgi:hypothetical protein